MHESPDLFEISILLLNQRHFFKRTLYKAVKAATIVGNDEAELNSFLKTHLRQLKNDATSFELWKGTYNNLNTEVRNCEEQSDELGIRQLRSKFSCAISFSVKPDAAISATQF